MKAFQIFILFVFLSITGFFAGCQKASINGYLDGRWQIIEFEENGKAENIKDQQLYYNFNLHVVSLSTYGEYYTDGNMLFKDNILWMDFPYLQTPEGELLLTRYGIYSNPVEFDIIKLTKETLIMKNGGLIITLRKF